MKKNNFLLSGSILVFFILNNSLFASKKTNYCSTYYEENFNNIISSLFKPINNFTLIKLKDSSSINSLKQYLNIIPYNKEATLIYLSKLMEQSKNIYNIKNKRLYKKLRRSFFVNARNLMLNIVLMDDIDLYKKYSLLNEFSKKYLKTKIISDLFIYIFNQKYKAKTGNDLFSIYEISRVKRLVYGKDKNFLKSIINNYTYLIYYKYVLKDSFLDIFFSNPKIVKDISKKLHKKLRAINRICFSSKRFNKINNRNLTNQQLFNLFNEYIYLNKNSTIYNYVFSHKISNHLWIYLDAMYNYYHRNEERAYKEFLILIKSEPKNNFLVKLIIEKSKTIFANWNKNPENYYKIWFYLSELFERLKPYKNYLFKNNTLKKDLFYLLEIYQKNSIMLKEYWMNKNIPDNVINVHNKTKYYLDYFNSI